MRQAEKKGLVVRNVAALADGPRVEEREQDPFTRHEILAIRARMEDDRLKTLFFVGLAKGLREGEAFGLRWSDLDLETGWLSVRQQVQRVPRGFEFVEPKTKSSKDRVELSLNQIQMLKEHLGRSLGSG
jgi:integrase